MRLSADSDVNAPESAMTEQTIILRPLDSEHKDITLTWFNDPSIAGFLGRTRTITEEEHNLWFQSLRQREDMKHFAIERVDNHRHIGNIWLSGIDTKNRKAEVSILLGDQDDRNAGMGTEALIQICQYAFESLNLHKVYAEVFAFNPRARRSFEKAGFILEGTLREDRWLDGSFVDVYRLARLRSDSATNSQNDV